MQRKRSYGHCTRVVKPNFSYTRRKKIDQSYSVSKILYKFCIAFNSLLCMYKFCAKSVIQIQTVVLGFSEYDTMALIPFVR